MEKEDLKIEVCKAIDRHREYITEIGRRILANPELGFKEFKTAAIVKEAFSKLSVKYTDEVAITGIRANMPGWYTVRLTLRKLKFFYMEEVPVLSAR